MWATMDLESLPSRTAPATALGGQAAVEMEAALSELGPERDVAAAMLRGCIDGNRRFMAGLQAGCLNCERRRLELVDGQFPGAIVIACSDSRVPPELLLDQGIGDLFVVRVAGNIVDRQALGSIEYALRHLDTRLVLVMGHTKCGAIKASLAEFVENAKVAAERMAAQEEELAAFDNLCLGDGSPPPLSKLQPMDGGQVQDGGGIQREQGGSPTKGKTGFGGPRRFFSRLLGLLGGEQEAATLVRTASFRDKDHLENPINDIVRAVKPAVKQVVWDLLHEVQPLQTPSLGGASPFESSSPVARFRVGSLGAPGSAPVRDDSAAACVADGCEADGCEHPNGASSCSMPTVGSFPGSPPPFLKGVCFTNGMQSPKARGAAVVDTKVARLSRQSVDIEALHRRLYQHTQAQEFCFDQHLLSSSDVANEVIYENVRRTCATVWHEMEKWLPSDIMQSTLMATAVYDLDSGHVDFFGLHS